MASERTRMIRTLALLGHDKGKLRRLSLGRLVEIRDLELAGLMRPTDLQRRRR